MTKNKKENKKESKIPIKNSKTEKEIAMDFATEVHRKFDRLIKATILFGSQAKNTASPSSDIDIIVIIDDASVEWDMELVSWYREELAKLIANNTHGRELHINTVKLTTWWQDLLYGDPVILNTLRYGEVLIDIGGFFNPLKALMLQGKIHSTPEAVYAALQRAPTHISRSHAAQLGAVEGIYWSMIDSSQAALMMAKQVPPSPEHIPEMLITNFVDKGMLKLDFVNMVKGIYVLHKSIQHGQTTHVDGAEIDAWQKRAEAYLSEMVNIVNLLLDQEKS